MSIPQTVVQFSKTVAAAGTAVALIGAETHVTEVHLMAKKVGGANTGNVFIGVSTVDKTTRQIIELQPGDYWEPPIEPGKQINLADLYIDAATTADGVVGVYWQ